MPLATTVVTPARFAQGLTYAEFLAQATVNQDKFEESYRSVPLTEADLSFFRIAAAAPLGLRKSSRLPKRGVATCIVNCRPRCG